MKIFVPQIKWIPDQMYLYSTFNTKKKADTDNRPRKINSIKKCIAKLPAAIENICF